MNKGFTLLELLIVIAIIGILSAIVLASLSQARLEAKDSKITSILTEMRTQAEMHYNSNGSYGNNSVVVHNNCSNFTTPSSMAETMFKNNQKIREMMLAALKSAPGSLYPVCNVGANGSWYVYATELNSDTPSGDPTFYCIDSYGRSGVYIGELGTTGLPGAFGGNETKCADA